MWNQSFAFNVGDRQRIKWVKYCSSVELLQLLNCSQELSLPQMLPARKNITHFYYSLKENKRQSFQNLCLQLEKTRTKTVVGFLCCEFK